MFLETFHMKEIKFLEHWCIISIDLKIDGPLAGGLLTAVLFFFKTVNNSQPVEISSII